MAKVPQREKIHKNTLFWPATLLNSRLNLVQAFEVDETSVIASLHGDDFDRRQEAGKGMEGEDRAMVECHRYPLRVQQSKLDGWWFIFVDEVPGLGVLGPNYEDSLDRLKVLAGNLFRARGETVTDIKIIPSERPALQVFH